MGSFGTVNLRDFLANADVEVVAICDVFKDNLEKAVALAGGKARPHHDYRRLLEDRDIDAVVITTPEHWHAPMCIDACDAGKDVYVEKPASHHIRDGRLMVEAARRKNRVVQVGIAAALGGPLPAGRPLRAGGAHRRGLLRRPAGTTAPAPRPGRR